MPINTSFAGPIPWLNLEPPTVALARGAQVGSQIAAARARNQAMRQDAEQFATQAEQTERRLKVAEDEAKEKVALASRRFAAQQAYQSALERDLTQAANEGDLDDNTATKIAAKHFLRYGPAMGEGFGSTLSSIVGSQTRNEASNRRLDLQETRDQALDRYRQERLELDETRVQQAAQRLQQGATRIELDKLGFSMREVDQALRGLSLGVELVRPSTQPSATPAPGQYPLDPTEAPATTPPITPNAKPVFRQIERPPTTSNITANQEALSASLSSLRQSNMLRPLINSSTFGPRAYVESKLIDKFLANQFPELLNKDRVAASVIADQLRGTTVRAVRSDSSIGVKEQENIIKNIPHNDKFFTSPAEALVQLDTINRGVIERHIRAARNLKHPITDELVPYVPKDLLQPLAREKLLTPAQGQEWYRQNRQQ